MDKKKVIALNEIARVQPVHRDMHSENEITQDIEITNQFLDLSRRRLVSLLPAIGMLTEINTLNLDSNSLQTLPAAITNMANLEILSLRDNRIQDLPAAFVKLTKLRYLDLTFNRLARLPDALSGMPSLDDLYLEHNPFEQEIEFPRNVKRLLDLSIVDCNQRTVSPTINHLESLCNLAIGRNTWKALPPMKGLSRLANLTITDMKVPLVTLPESLRDLTYLVYLSCRNSGLHYLPEWIGNLPSLEVLDLHGNCLKEIPSSIGRLQRLTTLMLQSNQLTTVPKSIATIPELSFLDLEDNPTKYFPSALFKQNPLLMILTTRNDPLTSNPHPNPPVNREPQRLDVQAARRLASHKENLTKDDLPDSCLELVGSAKQCSTLNCNGIFIRGGGVEEQRVVRFGLHETETEDLSSSNPVLIDEHTCDFECYHLHMMNRTSRQ